MIKTNFKKIYLRHEIFNLQNIVEANNQSGVKKEEDKVKE